MQEIIEYIKEELREYSIYTAYHAKTGSYYLKSCISGVHQIRVADHKGKGYAYKWEIRPDVVTQTGVGKYYRNYYNVADIDIFIARTSL